MRASTARAVAAGTTATLLMDAVTWVMYRQQSEASLAREGELRPLGGKDTAHALARRMALAVGSDVAAQQPNAAGVVVHHAMGVLPSMLYAKLRDRYPALRRGYGALYGFSLYVVNDLAATRLLGIASKQTAYPWQAHARGIVGHVVLGVGIETWLNALDGNEAPRACGGGVGNRDRG
jgi:hypothetical protein